MCREGRLANKTLQITAGHCAFQYNAPAVSDPRLRIEHELAWGWYVAPEGNDTWPNVEDLGTPGRVYCDELIQSYHIRLKNNSEKKCPSER